AGRALVDQPRIEAFAVGIHPDLAAVAKPRRVSGGHRVRSSVAMAISSAASAFAVNFEDLRGGIRCQSQWPAKRTWDSIASRQYVRAWLSYALWYSCWYATRRSPTPGCSLPCAW